MPRRSRGSDAIKDEIASAHGLLGWGGFVLPKMQTSGGGLYPVIEWTAAAYWRRAEGPDPTYCRPTLSEWETTGPPTAVRIVGYLHEGTPAAGIDKLKAVAAYGPGAITVRSASAVGRWTMAEADVAGISVVECRSSGRHGVVFRGRDSALATARRTVATRLREEQLYAWALVAGLEPDDRLAFRSLVI